MRLFPAQTLAKQVYFADVPNVRRKRDNIRLCFAKRVKKTFRRLVDRALQNLTGETVRVFIGVAFDRMDGEIGMHILRIQCAKHNVSMRFDGTYPLFRQFRIGLL